MAHKLARMLWHLLKFKQAFDWNVFAQEPTTRLLMDPRAQETFALVV